MKSSPGSSEKLNTMLDLVVLLVFLLSRTQSDVICVARELIDHLVKFNFGVETQLVTCLILLAFELALCFPVFNAQLQ